MTEEEAVFVLRAIIEKERRHMQLMLEPFIAELTHLEARRPLQPVTLPDGRVMIYKGPTATDLGGLYAAPRWLQSMADNDPTLRYELGRFRRGNAPEIDPESDHQF